MAFPDFSGSERIKVNPAWVNSNPDYMNQLAVLPEDLSRESLELSYRHTYDFLSQVSALTGRKESFNWRGKLVSIIVCAVAAFGLLTNIVNVIVYKRMGKIKDNTVFLCLSGVDVLHHLVLVAYGVMQAMKYFKGYDSVGDMSMSGEVNIPRITLVNTINICILVFQSWTCWMTVFIACQRCLCVLFPFKVKTLFTTKRNVICIVTIFILSLATCMLIDPDGRLQNNLWNPPFNQFLILKITPIQSDVLNGLDYLVLFISPWLAIVLNIFLTSFLAYRLYSTAKWRQAATSASNQATTTTTTTTDITTTTATTTTNNNNTTGDEYITETQQPKSSSVLSDKDLKLIRLVMAISIVFTITYLPFSIIKVLIKYNIQVVGHSLTTFSDEVSMILKSVNSGTNILFYYSLGSRYKKVFRQMLRLKEA